MPFIKHEVIPYEWNDQKILNLESPHMCHSADGFVSWCCGEFWFESQNTSRPRLQVSSFKTSLLNSDLLQNASLHTMNQDGKEVYNINSNMNKCYWHSPLKVQLWRFSGNRGGINVSTTVLYPPWVIPCGIHGMGGGFHGMVDGFHGMVDGFHTFPDGFHMD